MRVVPRGPGPLTVPRSPLVVVRILSHASEVLLPPLI